MAELVDALVFMMVSIRRTIRNSQLLYLKYVRWFIRKRLAVFPSLSLSAHIHTTVLLKLAVRHDVPTMVLVRDPVSTCCFQLLKHHIAPTPKEVESLLKDYIEYHDFVFLHKEIFRILKYEDVVSFPGFIIRSVSEFLKLSMSSGQIKVKAQVGQRLAELKESQKAVEGISLPNEMRKQMKLGAEEHVVNHPLCAHANEIYESIIPKG